MGVMETRLGLHRIVCDVGLGRHESHIVAARAGGLPRVLTSAKRGLIQGATGPRDTRSIASSRCSVTKAFVIAPRCILRLARRCGHVGDLRGLQLFQRVVLVDAWLLLSALDLGSIYLSELRMGCSIVAILGQLLLAWVSMLEKFLTLALLTEHLQLSMLVDLIRICTSVLLIQRVRLWWRVALRCCQVIWDSWSILVRRLMEVRSRAQFVTICLDLLNFLRLLLLVSATPRTLLSVATS